MDEEKKEDKKEDKKEETSKEVKLEEEEEKPEEKEEEPKEEKAEARIDNNPDKKNPWMISSIILGIIVIVLLVIWVSGVSNPIAGTGNVIAGEDAADKIIEYLNTRAGGGVEFVSFGDLGSLYEIIVEFEGQEIPVFITKDGEYFIQGAVPLGEVTDTPIPQPTPPPVDVPKSDKPQVELFVMTHCPYGTQAEKGFVPVLEALGDKIDGSIKFVHYFLHDPENDETPIQICLREEQPDKYLDYLKCFLEDGDSDRCLEETKIDQTKLNKCIVDNYAGFYQADSGLSEGYGVKGSPTLVINGQIANSGRSSSAYLDTICNAFNEAPEECNLELDSTSPNPGFGYSASEGGSNTQAQC